MLTTKEAIEKRRSIRKFKPDAVSREILEELINAARLAPSACNSQAWRFKIVADQIIKDKLAEAARQQRFVAQAPIVIVCCASLKEYVDDLILGTKDLADNHVFDQNIVELVMQGANYLRGLTPAQLGAIVEFNVAIAIEHIMLRALDFGLGTCLVRSLDKEKVRQIFNWDETMFVSALLPIGYPAENPEPRRRKPLSEIII